MTSSEGSTLQRTTAPDLVFHAGLVTSADAFVAAAVAPVAELAHRPAMSRLLALLTVYSEPNSAHYRSALLPAGMAACVARLEGLQGSSGLFDGTNLSSPPDSAFTINDACMALEIAGAASLDSLPEVAGDDQPGGESSGDPERSADVGRHVVADVVRRLRGIVARITDALVGGGVHTPNHRWELCAALARIHALHEREGTPRPEIGARIEQWLAEGIDQLPDGMYSERSPLYATAVTNPSLLAIADYAEQPALLDHVRRNLGAFLQWFSEDGSVESLFSRRQDQWLRFDGEAFTLLYRRMANQDHNVEFARAAAWLSRFPLVEPAKALARTRLDPWIGTQLPGVENGGTSLPLGMVPAHTELASCGIHRFQSQGQVLTVYGGCDNLIPGVVSGLSSNPTFLRLCHGQALLSDVRLSRSFFDLGPFRSSTAILEAATDQTRGGGPRVMLHEEQEATFYLPLPPERHRSDGIYALGHEGRFSASMDFDHRPTVPHHLRTDVAVTPRDDGADLVLSFAGAETSFALELTFRDGGELTGVEATGEPGVYVLTAGMGSYRAGNDVIDFGPGVAGHPDSPAIYNPGEAYRYLGGTNATDGLKVFIAGRTVGTTVVNVRVRRV